MLICDWNFGISEVSILQFTNTVGYRDFFPASVFSTLTFPMTIFPTRGLACPFFPTLSNFRHGNFIYVPEPGCRGQQPSFSMLSHTFSASSTLSQLLACFLILCRLLAHFLTLFHTFLAFIMISHTLSAFGTLLHSFSALAYFLILSQYWHTF